MKLKFNEDLEKKAKVKLKHKEHSAEFTHSNRIKPSKFWFLLNSQKISYTIMEQKY